MLAGVLEVQMRADMARMAQDMAEARRTVDGAMGGIEHAAEKAKLALEAVGIGLGVHELKEMFMGLIEVGDGMASMAERTGIAVKELAAYKLAADQSNTNIEAVAKGVKGLSVFITEHGERLRQAGIDTNNTSEAMRQLADVFAALPDGPTKAALAVKLFGKAGMDLIPMLNLGSKGLEEASEKAEKYAEALAKFAPEAKKFDEAMKEMALNSQEAKISLMQGVVEGLNLTIEKFKEAREAGISFIPALTGIGVRGLNETVSESVANAAKHIVDLNEQIAKAEKDRDYQRQQGDAINAQAYQNDINRLTKLVEYYKRLQREAALAGAAGAYSNEGRGAGVGRGDAEGTAKALLGISDAAMNYLAELRNKLHAAQGDASEYSKVLQAIASGPAKEFDAATKSTALSLAWQIDQLNLARKAIEDHARVLAEVDKVTRDVTKSMDEYSLKQQQAVDDMKAATERIGLSPIEAARQAEMRRIDKETETEIEKITEKLGKLGDIEGINEAVQKLREGAEAAKKAWNDAYDENTRKSREWVTGMKDAFHTYIDEAGNAAAQANRLFTNAFHSMEDALVNFVKTGKLDFRSLADSIITEMIRIQVQRSIMLPLMGTGKDGDYGILGSIGKSVGSVFGGGDGGMINMASDLFGFATGGDFKVGGSGGTDSQLVSFMATPGEHVSVRTPQQTAGDGPSVVVHQTIQISTGVQQTVRAEVMSLMPQIQEAALSGVIDARRRGGAARLAFQG